MAKLPAHPKATPRSQSTYKDRWQWFRRRASYPLRDAPPLELEKFWEHRDQFQNARGLNWDKAGPFNYAGRVTSLVVDPHHPDKLFAGSAAGGVWRSHDGGKSWDSSWPNFANQNIGALAIHPTQSKRLVCATGEANLSPDSSPGSGVYSTDDGGVTWTPYFSPPEGGPLPDELRKIFPRRIGTIAFGHVRSHGLPTERIALGTVSLDETMPAGLYLDEGDKGLQPNTSFGFGSRTYNCHSVLFHPTEHKRIFAAIEPRGSLNGIWRSDDFGGSWTQLKRGLPPGEECGRISLAISRSDPEIMYALAADRHRRVLGIFRTVNGGKSWRECGSYRFRGERFMSYTNTICIHPEDPMTVIWGGVNLHRSRDGGRHWKQITTGARGRSNFVHPDQHAIAMPGGDLIYSGNDGGVAVSKNGGETWHDRSAGMMTTMFYAVDVAQSNSKVFGGGAQDAGTLITGVGGKPGEYIRVLAGDGGWLEFDPTDEEHVFGSSQDLSIARHRAGEPWANGVNVGTWTDVSPKIPDGQEKKQRAIAVMEIEPGRRKGTRKVWVGTSRLWRTSDDGETWRPVSPFFDGSAISAIEISTADPQVMFVGTTDGGIFCSVNGGKTWSQNLAGPNIPPRLITRIETHPRTSKTVAVTVASTGAPGAALRRINPDDTETPTEIPYSHVFLSNDMGNTWTDIDVGGLPNVVQNALAYETHPPYRLFVGGDAGVWAYVDNSWISISGNLPNVMVSDLVFHHKDRILTAATYGRGIWRLLVTGPFDLIQAASGQPKRFG